MNCTTWGFFLHFTLMVMPSWIPESIFRQSLHWAVEEGIGCETTLYLTPVRTSTASSSYCCFPPSNTFLCEGSAIVLIGSLEQRRGKDAFSRNAADAPGDLADSRSRHRTMMPQSRHIADRQARHDRTGT